jgi:hypothetical protein
MSSSQMLAAIPEEVDECAAAAIAEAKATAIAAAIAAADAAERELDERMAVQRAENASKTARLAAERRAEAQRAMEIGQRTPTKHLLIAGKRIWIPSMSRKQYEDNFEEYCLLHGYNQSKATYMKAYDTAIAQAYADAAQVLPARKPSHSYPECARSGLYHQQSATAIAAARAAIAAAVGSTEAPAASRTSRATPFDNG